MGLASDRLAALTTIWNRCLDWREPRYHGTDFAVPALSAMRTREIAAMQALSDSLVAQAKLAAQDAPDAAALAALADG